MFRRGGVKNTRDERGTVLVKLSLSDGGKQHRVGNMTKMISVRNSKVSTVSKAIEKALFGVIS